jgi:hypothetical protein
MATTSQQLAMKLQSDETMESMMMNMPMKISDAASMLRKQVNKNERPYEKIVLTRNNRIVDRWYNEVLMKICDRNGTVPAGRVSECFNYFYQGLEITQFMRFREHLLFFDEKKVMFWIEFLMTKSIDELHEAGPAIVASAWSMITNAIKYHFAEKVWEAVYSKSDDPKEWDRLANENPHVMHGRPMPFGLTTTNLSDMEGKVSVVVRTVIEPTK